MIEYNNNVILFLIETIYYKDTFLRININLRQKDYNEYYYIFFKKKVS